MLKCLHISMRCRILWCLTSSSEVLNHTVCVRCLTRHVEVLNDICFYRVRCKDRKLCNAAGARVVITDHTRTKLNRTDLVLSSLTFAAKLRVVDVEYKRVPCEYKRKNLVVRVEDQSRAPGKLDIVVVHVAQVGSSSSWMFMTWGAPARSMTSGRPRRLLSLRHARVEVKARERVNNQEQSKEPKKKLSRLFIQYPS